MRIHLIVHDNLMDVEVHGVMESFQQRTSGDDLEGSMTCQYWVVLLSKFYSKIQEWELLKQGD